MERLLLLVSLGVSANAFHVPNTPVLHRKRLVRHAFFDVELSKPMVRNSATYQHEYFGTPFIT